MSQKHIVIEENSQELAEIKKLLSIEWGTTPLVPSAPPKNGFSMLDKKVNSCQFKENWRLPWDMLDRKNLYKMKYHVTISPDPIHESDFYNRKFAHKILRQFLEEIKKKGLFKNIIIVYEYGKRGKKYGKLHWHMLFETNKIRKIEEISNSYFATSKKRSRNTTVVKRIRIDKNMIDKSDESKVENYQRQIDYIMSEYMQKETQNKIKCLYTNMRLK